MPVALIALLLAAAPAAPPPTAPAGWGYEKSQLTSGPQFARSKATCRRVGPPRPPAADRPTPAQSAALKGCRSEPLYYGEGAKPDYLRARQCAFVEADAGRDEVFGGNTILMQVYANGLGVKKDLDLATAYACLLGGAPAEDDGRVNHLQDLKTKPERARFDFCDDITSGYAQGFCQKRASTRAGIGRDGRLAATVARLSPAGRAAYPALKAAFDAFLKAHAQGEVDLSGTARAAQVFQEEDEVKDAFAKDLQRIADGSWPAAGPAYARTSDAALNAAYRKALAGLGGKDTFTTVRPEAVRAAQRAWIPYRDAFVRFAAAAAPRVTASAVLTELTDARTAQLEGLVP